MEERDWAVRPHADYARGGWTGTGRPGLFVPLQAFAETAGDASSMQRVGIVDPNCERVGGAHTNVPEGRPQGGLCRFQYTALVDMASKYPHLYGDYAFCAAEYCRWIEDGGPQDAAGVPPAWQDVAWINGRHYGPMAGWPSIGRRCGITPDRGRAATGSRSPTGSSRTCACGARATRTTIRSSTTAVWRTT